MRIRFYTFGVKIGWDLRRERKRISMDEKSIEDARVEISF